ncbi:hypothetical protein ABIB48_000874 [Arthrobacter sp. UYCu511]|uniref:hypothetical protein n=1 Tax=unclassified Arthrobacter TaxID=235627 RepID=UPI0028F6FD5A|nr:hypothetical protein [Arthrobacter sp. lap29]
MHQQPAPLRISLAEIAELTRVQRPVVSMWRSRSKGTENPFPEPANVHRGQQLFDAAEVMTWLETTHHGNNPQAPADMAAYARADSARTDPEAAFASLSALVTLRYLTGQPLNGLDHDDLLDAADDHDPDNVFLYSEIEALGSTAMQQGAHADGLVDAAYSPAAAFEHLLGERFRAGLRDHADTALADPAIELAARCAVELGTAIGARHPIFVDPTPGSSDLLVAVAGLLPEDADPTFITPNAPGQAPRTALCRLLVHGVHRECLEVTGSGQFSVQDPAVHVAAYPSAGAPDMAAADILASIENTVLQMDDRQRGVIMAPATVLTDALTEPAAAVRSDLLRSGRVRAIVRLPAGLVPAKTRQSLALWMLGPALAAVPIAERWTMVADLSGTTLSRVVVQDLVSDLAVSMDSAAVIRAHSMRFAHLVPTSRLLAMRGALVRPATERSTSHPAEQAVRADQLIALLNGADTTPAPLPIGLTLGQGTGATATVQQLLDKDHLKYQTGARLDPNLSLTDDAGPRVLGLPELGLAEPLGRAQPSGLPEAVGGAGVRERRIQRLVLARTHPNARLTEPGDVVFATTPTPAAMVDAEGGAVVEYPARVLRVSAMDPGGLMPELLAADINGAASKEWRSWSLRLIPHSTVQALRPVLLLLETEQAAVQLRLQRLNELTTLIRDGVSAGGMVVDANIVLT